jgi:hypothetical protein
MVQIYSSSIEVDNTWVVRDDGRVILSLYLLSLDFFCFLSYNQL